MTYFASTTCEIGDWGASVQSHIALAEFNTLAHVQWVWLPGVLDLGTTR